MVVRHTGRNKWFTVALQRNEAMLLIRRYIGTPVSRETSASDLDLVLKLIDFCEVAFHGAYGNATYYEELRSEAEKRLGANARPPQLG